MRVFAPPGGGGELGRAGDVGGEDYFMLIDITNRRRIYHL
jgi:hypothetical protein